MLALDIHTDVARYELANLSERVKFGMNQKAVQGEYPGGKIIGHLRNRYNKSIEVDTERAAIIKELFVLYADSEKDSIDDLHYHATGIGLRYRGSNRPISRSEIERILKKPFYIGRFRWNGVTYQGDHPALVDEALFEKVQDVFKNRSKGRFARKDFQYSRMMLCGQCGHTITAEVKKRKYVYYHFTGFGKSHKPTYVRESTLHSQFAQLISQVALPDGWYNYLKECLESESMRRDRVLKTQRNRIESARSKVIADMKKTFQAKLDGLLDNDFFQEVFRDLQSRKESLERQDQALESGADSLYDTALETIELASNQIESLYLEANSESEKRIAEDGTIELLFGWYKLKSRIQKTL